MIQPDGFRLIDNIHVRCNIVIAVVLQFRYAKETMRLRRGHSAQIYVTYLSFYLYLKFKYTVKLVEVSFLSRGVSASVYATETFTVW